MAYSATFLAIRERIHQDFQVWFQHWTEEMRERPWRLDVKVPERLGIGALVHVDVFPDMQRWVEESQSGQPADKDVREKVFCVFMEKLTAGTANQLRKRLDLIKRIEGLEYTQGVARMTYDFLVRVECERAVRGLPSLFTGVRSPRFNIDASLRREFKKKPSVIPGIRYREPRLCGKGQRGKVGWKRGHPVFRLESMLGSWEVDDSSPRQFTDSHGTPFQFSYLAIPPIPLTAEGLTKDIGKEFALGLKIPIRIDPVLAPLISALKADYVLRRLGAWWVVRYEGREPFMLNDSLGLQYIAKLLGHPGEEITALELVVWVAGKPASHAGETYAKMTNDQLAEEDMRKTNLDYGDTVIDPQARAEYTAELRELNEEISEAERINEVGKLAKLKEEKEMLINELRSAVGLSGRLRKTSSPAEKARKRVWSRVTDSLRLIGEKDKALKEHLDKAIRKGQRLEYRPPKPLSWSL